MELYEFVQHIVGQVRMSVLEGVMLLCFGLSWPVSIFKTVKAKSVSGKSPLFVAIIALGYVFGILHKIFYSLDFIIFFYFINFTLILTDLYLYAKYYREGSS